MRKPIVTVAALLMVLEVLPLRAATLKYVVADDGVREWGAQDWEKKSAEYRTMGYIPVSMKDDFAQIYPEGITKAESQYLERDWSEAAWYQQNAA